MPKVWKRTLLISSICLSRAIDGANNIRLPIRNSLSLPTTLPLNLHKEALVSGYDYTFEGTLTGCSQSDIYKLNIDGDAFTLNSTSIEINPFEAYFTMNHENATETAAKQLAIGMIDDENGNTNGIDEMEIQSEVSFVIYNLNGMEVGRGEAALQALPHGVYIVNGRKIVK